MSTILDAEECWDIVIEAELEPQSLDYSDDDDEGVEDVPSPAEIATRVLEIKDRRRRFKKAASLITQSVDDSLVQMLNVHNKNPILIWAALASDFNTITPAQQSLARQDFQNFVITEDETHLEIKQNFKELLRKVVAQNGTVSAADQLQTLLGALPERFDMLRESFFAQPRRPDIEFLWMRMFDIETT